MVYKDISDIDTNSLNTFETEIRYTFIFIRNSKGNLHIKKLPKNAQLGGIQTPMLCSSKELSFYFCILIPSKDKSTVGNCFLIDYNVDDLLKPH